VLQQLRNADMFSGYLDEVLQTWYSQQDQNPKRETPTRVSYMLDMRTM